MGRPEKQTNDLTWPKYNYKVSAKPEYEATIHFTNLLPLSVDSKLAPGGCISNTNLALKKTNFGYVSI